MSPLRYFLVCWYRAKHYSATFGIGIVVIASVLCSCAQTRTTGQCNELATPYQRYDCMRDTIFGAESRARRTAISATIINGAVSFGQGGSYSASHLVQAMAKNAQVPAGVTGGIDGGFQVYWGDLVSKTNNNLPRMASEALSDIKADSYRLDRFVRISNEVAAADEELISQTLATSRAASAPKEKQGAFENAINALRKRQVERSEVSASLAQVIAIYQKVFMLLQIDNSPEAQQGLAAFAKYVQLVQEDFNRCNRAFEAVNLGKSG